MLLIKLQSVLYVVAASKYIHSHVKFKFVFKFSLNVGTIPPPQNLKPKKGSNGMIRSTLEDFQQKLCPSYLMRYFCYSSWKLFCTTG